MRNIWIMALLFLLAGCSGGVRSSAVDMDLRIASPFSRQDDGVPVVYPYQYQQAGNNGSRDPMVNAFGPSWKSLEPVYSEYRFNP